MDLTKAKSLILQMPTSFYNICEPKAFSFPTVQIIMSKISYQLRL